MQKINLKNLRTAVLLSAIIAVSLFVLTAVIGRNESFLLLNGNAGTLADYFFAGITELGNGALWLVLAIVFFKYRKNLFLLSLYTFAASTIITQIFKYLIIPDEPRPSAAITEEVYHFVKSVELHSVSSFPSGHSATAFCFYFLCCIAINKPWIVVAGLFYSVTVAYSRIYLAQHFPLDVAGGITVAIISIFISLYLVKRFHRLK